jgi:hypothetical protein
VWHSAIRCHFKVHKLERTIVTLKTPLRGGNAFLEQTDELEPA